MRITHLAWKILATPHRHASGTSTQNRNLFLILEMAHTNLLRRAKEYRIYVDIVDSCSKTGLKVLDAQVEIILSAK